MKDKILNTGLKMFPNNINMIPQIEEENLKKENADDLAMLFNSLVLQNINSIKIKSFIFLYYIVFIYFICIKESILINSTTWNILITAFYIY